MSDAPEKLWVDYAPHTESYEEVFHEDAGKCTQYIRADALRALIAEGVREGLEMGADRVERDGHGLHIALRHTPPERIAEAVAKVLERGPTTEGET